MVGCFRGRRVSKYDQLWRYIADRNMKTVTLTFDEIRKINGIEIDHSFLNFKKELVQFGFSVGKISLKNKTVEFNKDTIE
jgi:hypothetical protein